MGFQDLYGGCWLARLENAFASGFGQTTLSSSPYPKSALAIRIPKTGTLDQIELLVGTVTVAQDVKISLQDLDPVTGSPDGVIDQYRVIPLASLISNTWIASGLLTSDGTDTGVKRTVTRGDWLTINFEFDSTIGNLGFDLTLNDPSTGWSAYEFVQHYTGAAWLSTTPALPNIALKYSDGTYACTLSGGYAVSSQTAVDLNTGTTPDEYALRFQLPFDATLAGLEVMLRTTAALVGASYDVVLYDASDVVLMTTPGPPMAALASAVPVFTLFPTQIPITRNTTYRLSIRPSTANSIHVHAFNVASTAILAACPGGSSWYLSTRTDAGAWTDTTTRRPWMSLGLSALSDGL